MFWKTSRNFLGSWNILFRHVELREKNISENVQKSDPPGQITVKIKNQTWNFIEITFFLPQHITKLQFYSKKPIGNSIITSFNRDQALKRFDRGKEAAEAVLKVLKLK